MELKWRQNRDGNVFGMGDWRLILDGAGRIEPGSLSGWSMNDQEALFRRLDVEEAPRYQHHEGICSLWMIFKLDYCTPGIVFE